MQSIKKHHHRHQPEDKPSHNLTRQITVRNTIHLSSCTGVNKKRHPHTGTPELNGLLDASPLCFIRICTDCLDWWSRVGLFRSTYGTFFFLFTNSRICEEMRLRVVGDLMVVSGLRLDGSTGTVFLEGFGPTLCYPSAVRRTWSIEYKV